VSHVELRREVQSVGDWHPNAELVGDQGAVKRFKLGATDE
jgi:hypothetical protein